MSETLEIVRKNLDRILSLEPVYVLTIRNNGLSPKETRLIRYIGYVLNKDRPYLVPVVHYFLINNKIRRYCNGDKFCVLDGSIETRENGRNYCAKTIRNSTDSVFSEAKDWLILSSDDASNNVVFDEVDTCFTALGYTPENGYKKNLLPLYFQ